MAKKSKRYLAQLEKAEAAGAVNVADAVGLLKSFGDTKFDQTVEVHMHLGVDPKQADQIIRGSLALTHGIGRELKIVVFAKGDNASAAEAAAILLFSSASWNSFEMAAVCALCRSSAASNLVSISLAR